jgi:hypothetical protein
MRRTRRSGNTAGEALPLQLHIAGPQKGAGSFFAPLVAAQAAAWVPPAAVVWNRSRPTRVLAGLRTRAVLPR